MGVPLNGSQHDRAISLSAPSGQAVCSALGPRGVSGHKTDIGAVLGCTGTWGGREAGVGTAPRNKNKVWNSESRV